MPETDSEDGAAVVSEAYPDMTVAERWVAVQFHERGPVLVLHEDGTVIERMTMPRENRAQLALGGAA